MESVIISRNHGLVKKQIDPLGHIVFIDIIVFDCVL